MCAYKKYGGKTNERPIILCPSPAPKRLLTSSNWMCRNDSSNVNAILHPENYLVSPRLKYGEKTEGNVIEKHILSRNNCYCRCKNKKLPKPTFFKRPNKCVSYEGVSKNIYGACDQDLIRESLVGCVCNDIDEDSDVPEPLKSRLTRLRQSKSAPVEVGLQFSDQRNKYKEYREVQEEKYEDKVQKYREYEQELMSGYEAGEGYSDIDTILGTQHYGHGTGTSLSSTNENKYGRTETRPDEYDDFSSEEFPQYSEQTVPDFRREHYFETHDIGKLAEIAGDMSKDHECIHQFKLDKRWLPDPVRKDNFGRSLCKLCDKPMAGSRLNLSSGFLFGEDGISKSKLRNYAESYQSGLMPKNINLSKGKSKIELVLKDSDIAGFSSYISKAKHPVYCNSLALRQQRMRLI